MNSQAVYRDIPTLSGRVCGLENSVDTLRDLVKSQAKQIEKCIKNERDTATALLKLQRDYNDLFKYANSLEEYCLDLDVNLRKRHLVLTGIEETAGEVTGRTRVVDEEGNEMETEDSNFNPTLSIVFDTLHAIHDTLILEDLDVVYRLGKKGPNPRPILVKFAKESVRNEVNRKRFHLKDTEENKTVFLNEDLPTKVNAYRADLRCLVNHAKSKNMNAKLLGNKVSIDNKIYGHKDIDKLPEGLRMCDAKMIDTVKGIAFQSQHAYLSNFFPCKIKYNGIQYNSAEHAYQHTRATFLGFHSNAESARRAGKAEEAKRACSNLPSSKEWDACKQKTMKDIVCAKFAQNLDLQGKLLSTGDRPLLEATYDSYWGCGFPLTAKKLREGNWHGKNYLGIILAECRFEMRREYVLRAQQLNPHAKMASHTHAPPQPTATALIKQPAQTKSARTWQSPKSNAHDSQQLNYSSGQLSNNQQVSGAQVLPPTQAMQFQQWQQQMMFQQQQQPFNYPPPMPNYFMYPTMPPLPLQMQPHPGPTKDLSSSQLNPLSPPYNNRMSFSRQTSTSPTASDYSTHGDRRLSYDPELSPVIHV